MVRLSIIIPFTGSVSSFEETLASVLANRPEACQVIASFPGPYDDPYDIASEIRILESATDANLLDLLNAGIAVSTGPIVHILLPGIIAAEGWTQAPIARLEDNLAVGSISPLITYPSGSQPVTVGVKMVWGAGRGVVRCRSARGPGVRSGVAGPLLSAGFYRRNALVALGGFDSRMSTEFSDLDLSLRLAREGYRCEVETACPLTSRRGLEPNRGRGFQRGKAKGKLFRRHYVATRPVSGTLLYALRSCLAAVIQLPRLTGVTELFGCTLSSFQRDTAPCSALSRSDNAQAKTSAGSRRLRKAG